MPTRCLASSRVRAGDCQTLTCRSALSFSARQKLSVAYNTAADAICRFERQGILQKVGEGRRNRVYCARGIMDILEEPARLMAERAS